MQVFIVLLYVFTKPLSMVLNWALGKEVLFVMGLGQLALRATTPSWNLIMNLVFLVGSEWFKSCPVGANSLLYASCYRFLFPCGFVCYEVGTIYNSSELLAMLSIHEAENVVRLLY